jgi:Flp pilus assembly protein TadG
MKKWLKVCSGTDAAEIAEFAIVLPILFFLILAMFWVGQAYNISNNLNKAATDGLSAALKNTCAVSCANTPATNAQIADAIETAFQAGNLKSGNLQAYTPTPNCPSGAITSVTSSSGTTYTVEICRSLPLWPGSTTPGTRVAMQYQMPIMSPVSAFRTLRVSAVVQGRPES